LTDMDLRALSIVGKKRY